MCSTCTLNRAFRLCNPYFTFCLCCTVVVILLLPSMFPSLFSFWTYYSAMILPLLLLLSFDILLKRIKPIEKLSNKYALFHVWYGLEQQQKTKELIMTWLNRINQTKMHSCHPHVSFLSLIALRRAFSSFAIHTNFQMIRQSFIRNKINASTNAFASRSGIQFTKLIQTCWDSIDSSIKSNGSSIIRCFRVKHNDKQLWYGKQIR